MIPVAPAISVRELDKRDSPALVALFGDLVGSAPYSSRMDTEAIEREIFGAGSRDGPPTVFPLQWQHHIHLGAWRAGELVGFLDAAVGLDSDNLDLPSYQAQGLIRFLALPARADLIASVIESLFAAAQLFWQQTGVGYVKAFHISTGYPSFQAGAGLLPGDWAEHVRGLTMAGFRLTERFYCYFRAIDDPVEEFVPLPDLSLLQRGARTDLHYQIYHRRIDWVGGARVVRMVTGKHEQPMTVAYVTHLEIDRRWRQQNIGRWLLRRMINDATMQGVAQMVVHLSHSQHAAINLFVQHGFQELNYRGYTLDKELTA